MKSRWIKLCSCLLAMLGFTSCGVSGQAAKTVPSEESPTVEQESPGEQPEPQFESTGTDIKVRPEIRVMYGPPPASYRK